MDDLLAAFGKLKIKRGANASKSGSRYEEEVYDICAGLKYVNGKEFCTIDKADLAGSTYGHDLVCNYKGFDNIPIEIKKKKTPDWMQLSLVYKDNKWVSNGKSKIPEVCRDMFHRIINEHKVYGEIPPFFHKNIRYNEWQILKEDFKDIYIDCPSNTISELYKNKGAKYIQISELGLYHLGEDICNFNVPYFICKQRLRIRVKIHKSNSDNNGYIQASVMAAAQPINYPIKSPYSLDDSKKIPTVLELL
jgi:hypothetical protein